MVAAFRHIYHDNTWLDAIDCLVASSPLVHVQIVFSNGQVGGAWRSLGGVAFRTIRETIIYPYLYSYVKLCDNKIDKQKTYDFIKKCLGEKFDAVGAIIPIFNKEKKWHCSSLIYSALSAGGMKPKNQKPSFLNSPQDIYDILTVDYDYPVVSWENIKFYDSCEV